MSTCYKCQKQGHIAKACRSQKSVSTAASHGSGTGRFLAARYQPGQPGSPYQNHQMQDLVSSYPKIMMRHQEGPARDAEADFNLFTLISAIQAPINLPIKINGPLVEFQLDTGASLTVVTQKDFEGITKGAVLLQKCHQQKAKLPLVLVEGEGPTLLGKNWLGELKLSGDAHFL